MSIKPREVKEYYVFLASPGDVNAERQEVRRFFEDYNLTTASPRGLRFVVIDWENCSTAGVGRPQELITSQTLERCRDHLALVIGIMGQRFGSPSGTHESGTEEEFAWALQSCQQTGWPEIKWFFRKVEKFEAPSEPEKILDALDQWKKVRAFRERLDGGKTLYFKEFLDAVNFRDVLHHDLALWLSDSKRPWVTSHFSSEKARRSPQGVNQSEKTPNPSAQSIVRIATDEEIHQFDDKVGRLEQAVYEVKRGTPLPLLRRAARTSLSFTLLWVLIGLFATAFAFYLFTTWNEEPPRRMEEPPKPPISLPPNAKGPIYQESDLLPPSPPAVSMSPSPQKMREERAAVGRSMEKRGQRGKETRESQPGIRTGEMVLIPAGEFWMGCNEGVDDLCFSDEKPGRLVELDAYSIDRYEVTVAEYRRCVDDGSCSVAGSFENCNWGKKGREKHPINCVTWNQAQTYCFWAGKRLPTEAEWEKAARGPDGGVYPWGNEWDAKRANGGSNGTVAVGSYATGVSPYGVHDMAGNVWEWVQDWYDSDYYKRNAEWDSQGPTDGTARVLRGGSWLNDPRLLRVSTRLWGAPGRRDGRVGFRCAE